MNQNRRIPSVKAALLAFLGLCLGLSVQAQDLFLESECGTVGLNWQTLSDANASNGEYSVYLSGNSTGSAPSGIADRISYDFTVSNSGTHYVFLRTLSPTSGNNSVWIRVNGGTWHASAMSVGTSFTWNQMNTGNNTGNVISVNLSAGSNTLDIAYREGGCLVDKILVSQTLPCLLVLVQPQVIVGEEAMVEIAGEVEAIAIVEGQLGKRSCLSLAILH